MGQTAGMSERQTVHFWTLSRLDDFGEWDPDVEPWRYANGFGHSFLEMFVRLRDAGYPVSIGRKAPKSASCLVVSLSEASGWRGAVNPVFRLKLALQALRCPNVAVIRNDLPLEVASPRPFSIEIMPSSAAIHDARCQVALPLLPQRGLIPRSEDRGARLETIVLKARAENVPAYAMDAGFIAELRSLGLELAIHTQKDTPNRWHDFSDVDAVLCTRAESVFDVGDTTYRRKPATKLINAWVAGVIPIIAGEASYLAELALEPKSAVQADGRDQIVAALSRLASSPAEREEVLAAGRRTRERFEVGRIVALWWVTLKGVGSVPRVGVVAEMLRAVPAAVLWKLRHSR